MSAEREPFALSTAIQQSIGLQSVHFDEESVIFDSLRNRVFRVNGSGAAIWRALEKQSTVDQVATAVSDGFHLDKDDAVDAVRVFLQDLFDLGLATADQSITIREKE